MGGIVFAIVILFIGAVAIGQVLALVGYTFLFSYSFYKGDRSFRTALVLSALAAFWVFVAVSIIHIVKINRDIAETEKSIPCHSAASKSVIVISYLDEGYDHQRVDRIVYYDLDHGGSLEQNAGLVFRLVDHLQELDPSKLTELANSPFSS